MNCGVKGEIFENDEMMKGQFYSCFCPSVYCDGLYWWLYSANGRKIAEIQLRTGYDFPKTN